MIGNPENNFGRSEPVSGRDRSILFKMADGYYPNFQPTEFVYETRRLSDDNNFRITRRWVFKLTFDPRQIVKKSGKESEK